MVCLRVATNYTISSCAYLPNLNMKHAPTLNLKHLWINIYNKTMKTGEKKSHTEHTQDNLKSLKAHLHNDGHSHDSNLKICSDSTPYNQPHESKMAPLPSDWAFWREEHHRINYLQRLAFT